MYRVKTTDVWFNMPGVVAAYQPVVAPDPIAARQNVRSNITTPSQNMASLGTAPGWSALTGWSFDGGTMYLKTGILPTGPWSYIVRFSNLSGVAGQLLGFRDASNSSLVWLARWNTTGSRYKNGTGERAGSTLSTGVMGMSGLDCYLNGVSDGTQSGTVYSGTTAKDVWIGAYNDRGNPLQWLTGNIQAVAIYSRLLTALEMREVSRQMKYCDQNQSWNVWGVRRRYVIPTVQAAAAAFNPAWAANTNRLIGGGL